MGWIQQFGVVIWVYKVIKWSFDSLESQDDIESSSVRGDIRSCFLYCSLYPAAISTNDLIHCWWAEGFLGEHDTYEEAYNRGITMIESLKDACLLEEADHKVDYVKMHDVVRDVAKWIDKSSKRMSFISNKIEHLTEFFLSFPALRVVNLSTTRIKALPSSISTLSQLRALILHDCTFLEELPPIGNLSNLQLLDCDNTRLRCLPQGMDKLMNLWLLYLPMTNFKKSIGEGLFLKLPRIEMLNMLPDTYWGMRNNKATVLVPTSFDEISTLHNLTCLYINFDSSSILITDYTWMKRLKRFHIEIGETSTSSIPFNKSSKTISVSDFENFKHPGMLQLASYLYLFKCTDLGKLIVNKKTTFNELKLLYIEHCSCDFGAAVQLQGSGQFDPMPNLEYLSLYEVNNLKSVSDFGKLLGLTFSKLQQLDLYWCSSLTCLFNAFSVSKHLKKINLSYCFEMVELFVQLETLGELLEELNVTKCDGIRKLPLSIQTSNNIKRITGESEWWSRLEWDDDNFKSNLEHCFLPYMSIDSEN